MNQLKRAKELLLERHPTDYQKEIKELELVLINNADGLFPLSSSLTWVHNKEVFEAVLTSIYLVDILDQIDKTEFSRMPIELAEFLLSKQSLYCLIQDMINHPYSIPLCVITLCILVMQINKEVVDRESHNGEDMFAMLAVDYLRNHLRVDSNYVVLV